MDGKVTIQIKTDSKSKKDYAYWLSNRDKYQKLGSREQYDQFLRDIKEHESKNIVTDKRMSK